MTSTSTATPTSTVQATPADIVREYGPFPGAGRVNGVTLPNNGAIGRFGYVGPGSLVGPNTTVLSTKIQKKFAITERDDRRALIDALCQQSRSELVQIIGKMALVYRKNPQPNKNLSNIHRYQA